MYVEINIRYLLLEAFINYSEFLRQWLGAAKIKIDNNIHYLVQNDICTHLYIIY